MWLDVHVREPWPVLLGGVVVFALVAVWARAIGNTFAYGFTLGTLLMFSSLLVMLWISAGKKTCQPIEESRR